ncbi:MAG: hypothetical protein ACI9LN_001552 [Saprospiraceae bacterium]|jgi:hypothetical protein
MTFQATIHYNETIHLITNLGDTQLTNSQHLVIQLDAPNTKSAQQAIKNRWQKIRQQLLQASAPKLLDLQ